MKSYPKVVGRSIQVDGQIVGTLAEGQEELAQFINSWESRDLQAETTTRLYELLNETLDKIENSPASLSTYRVREEMAKVIL